MTKKLYAVMLCCVASVIVFIVLVLYGTRIWTALGFGCAAALDRAQYESNIGNINEAVKWCDEAVRRNPKSIPSYYMLGKLHERQGNYRSAIEDYSNIIALDPIIPDYHVDRGRVYEARGDLDSAVTDYCDAILSEMKGEYTIHSWAEARAGRFGPDTLDEMIGVFEKAIVRHPQDKRIQQSLNDLRHAKKRPWKPSKGGELKGLKRGRS